MSVRPNANFPALPPPVTPLGYRRILSPTAGVRVSPLCLGNMSLGGKMPSHTGNITKEEAFAVYDEFYNSGGNFIDTAPGYHVGEAEEWLGEWMKLRNNRDQLVIASKYGSPNGEGTDANQRGTAFKNMTLTIRDTLKRLQTDYIDVYYIHFWDHTTSVEEVMRGLHKFVMEGKILYPAVSDTPAWVVVKANDYARQAGLSPFVLYQGLYNVLKRDLEREVIPMLRDQGMGLAPWGVIGQGKFQTKETIEARKASGEMVRGGGQVADDERISEALEKVGKEVGASLSAVAIAWALQKTPYMFPIIGGRKVTHLKDNIRALSLTLTPTQLEYLESVLPFDFGFPFDRFGTDPHASGGRETNMVLNGAEKILYVEVEKAPKIPTEDA
ncbi:hypothetical protein MNV49_001039 [Pseudohyphozyma bogoriensis]|nr:hypothetical protein MNV49_001039 [Pseudohyphozyma bogoriensis]